MKTLKKGSDFKRLPDSSFKDLKEINSYIKSGWKFCPKKDYKDTFEKKYEEKEEKKSKKNK